MAAYLREQMELMPGSTIEMTKTFVAEIIRAIEVKPTRWVLDPGLAPIKVYALNDFEWWAGPSLESCIREAMHQTGLVRDEVVEDSREVSREELEQMTIHPDCSDLDPDDAITGAKWLAVLKNSGEKFPCLFSTTEC